MLAGGGGMRRPYRGASGRMHTPCTCRDHLQTCESGVRRHMVWYSNAARSKHGSEFQTQQGVGSNRVLPSPRAYSARRRATGGRKVRTASCLRRRHLTVGKASLSRVAGRMRARKTYTSGTHTSCSAWSYESHCTTSNTLQTRRRYAHHSSKGCDRPRPHSSRIQHTRPCGNWPGCTKARMSWCDCALRTSCSRRKPRSYNRRLGCTTACSYRGTGRTLCTCNSSAGRVRQERQIEVCDACEHARANARSHR